MAVETYSDATPDSNMMADRNAIVADNTTIASDSLVEVASTTSAATLAADLAQDLHLQDQAMVSADDLVIQARQRQLDLVQNVYGTTNASDIAAAQAVIASMQNKKAADQARP